MATTVGSHSVSAFATPVNGGPLDANVVRGNDNTIRTAYVAHDADTGIHVQSSTLANRPAAGTAGRKWITADTGVYKLWYDDGTTWHEVAAGNIDVFVIADEALVKGDVIKVTGYNNGTGAPRVAKVSSASDVAFGIVNSTSIANGATGYITNTGLIQDVATNAFSVGDILYPNTSGGFTATKPTSGNYQPIAFVLRSNANNGVLYVEFSTPRIVERSDNTASTIVLRDASGNFSAGTITAGAVTSTGLVTFASLKGTGATTVTNILDEDNMASDSATALATQQSIKAYVDAKVATVDTLAEVLANGNTTGANNIIVSAGQKIQTPAIAAGDGTASATIANSTGVMTIASSVLTTTDINGGTIDGTTIGGSSAAAGTFTTVGATTGNITTVNATTVDTTNIEVTNVKAKDGTASIAIADSTGVATISAAPVLSALTASQAVFTDASKGLVSNAITGTGNVVMSASPTLTGTVTAATLNATTLGGTLSTAAQTNITSVGTLTSLTVSGGATFASTSGNFGIGTTSPVDTDGFGKALDVRSATGGQLIIRDSDDTTRYGRFAYDGTDNSAWVEATGTGSLIRFRTAGTQKMSLDASGNLAVDTNTLYVDAANNRVGIGTASPGSPLDVIRSSTSTISLNEPQIRAINTAAATLNQRVDIAMRWEDGTYNGTGGISMVRESATARSGSLVFSSINSSGDATQAMRLDASGNLGLGVTPSAWNTGYKALQISSRLALSGTATETLLGNNWYQSTGGNSLYLETAAATLYRQVTGQHQWYNAPSGTAGNAITFTQAMTLDASGNLGVGVTSPQSTIDAYRSTGGAYFRGGSGDPGRQLKFSSSTTTNAGDTHTIDAQSGTGILAFAVTSTERARITSGGYFKASNDGTYYGSTSSYHELRTSGAAGDWTITVTNATATAASCYGIQVIYPAASPNGTGNAFLTMGDSTTTRAAFRSNGGLANYQANNVDLSDARTKKDITPLDSMWDKVAALEIVSYKYIDQTHDDVNLGVIAQQVETVEPVWVDTDGFGDTPEGEEPMKTVYNKDITFAAIKALQEAMARIEALEARLEALEA